jgi:probable F420-dependent oxidoreductase
MRADRDALGRVGVWSRELRFHPDRAAACAAAAELETLGYGALWIPDVGGDVFGAAGELLGATSRIAVATGIINIWMHEAASVAAQSAEVSRTGRFLCGLGAGHAKDVDADRPGRYRRPLSVMRDYLDELDVAQPPLPSNERILAALGPKMLELSRDRAGGAHPYCVPVSHTERAREILGPERLLAPEQGVILTDDPVAGRELARTNVAMYLGLPNYVANFERMGFDETDWAGGPSDRLVDALIVYGDEATIAERVSEHLAAGADHVCIQVIGMENEALALEQWRRLAPALTSL